MYMREVRTSIENRKFSIDMYFTTDKFGELELDLYELYEYTANSGIWERLSGLDEVVPELKEYINDYIHENMDSILSAMADYRNPRKAE